MTTELPYANTLSKINLTETKTKKTKRTCKETNQLTNNDMKWLTSSELTNIYKYPIFSKNKNHRLKSALGPSKSVPGKGDSMEIPIGNPSFSGSNLWTSVVENCFKSHPLFQRFSSHLLRTFQGHLAFDLAFRPFRCDLRKEKKNDTKNQTVWRCPSERKEQQQEINEPINNTKTKNLTWNPLKWMVFQVRNLLFQHASFQVPC